MAGYSGTFSCGHEGKVYVTGPHKTREYIIERKFSGLCPECWEKHLQAEKERKNKEAEEKAKEMELLELTGTEKQIAWANTLRQKLIDNFTKVIDQPWEKVFLREYDKENYERKEKRLKEAEQDLQELANEEDIEEYTERIQEIKYNLKKLKKDTVDKKEVILVLDYILNTFTSSTFYIDTRDYNLDKFIEKFKEEALKTDEEKLIEKQEKYLEEEIKKEATVYPERRITDAVVILENDENLLKAKFEKNEKFREIVKNHNLYWKDSCWRRFIGFKNGTIEDRMAELGNALLAEGFPVRIMDKKIRDMAISGSFESEQYNWIDTITKGELLIQWLGYSNKLYAATKKLPGARWNSNLNGFNIKIEHAAEVEEFARLYNFNFTDSAIEAVEKFKESLKGVNIVAPAKVKKQEQKDGLEEILNSSTDVLDDLMEDD